MGRTVNLSIKEDLLEKSFRYVLEMNSLNYSINTLGKSIGSSGRMLIYHFKSKEHLDTLIVARIEESFRQQFKLFANEHGIDKDFLLKLWDHLTSHPSLVQVLKLSFEAAYHSAKRGHLKITAVHELSIWRELLLSQFRSEEIANLVLVLFQGAIVDFLISGSPEFGRRAILQLNIQGFVDLQMEPQT